MSRSGVLVTGISNGKRRGGLCAMEMEMEIIRQCGLEAGDRGEQGWVLMRQGGGGCLCFSFGF